MSPARWSLIAAIATMAVWGVNFPFVKYVLENIGPGPFLFMRFLVMPLLGFALLAVVFRRNPRQAMPAREDWPRLAFCGLLGHTAVGGLVAAWAVTAASLVGLVYLLVPGEILPAHLIAGGVVLALPLVRLLAAPLALEWNRHR